MISRLLSFFSKKEKEKKPTAKDKIPFRQADILKAHGENGKGEGLCAPLANLYAKHQLGMQSSRFLHDPEVAYKEAVIEENHQEDLLDQHKDGLHSAFVDSNTPYSVEVVPIAEVIDEEKLAQHIGPVPVDSLITFPVSPDEKHMIYLGKDDKDRGFEYDANRYTQEITASSSKILHFTAHSIKKEALKDDTATATIALAPRQKKNLG